MGAALILPGRLLGPDRLSDRQRFYARVLLALGLISLVLSWGQNIGPIYRFLFDYLPLMDKWRDPLKWLEMFNFALMPLMALGLDHLGGTLAPEAKSQRTRFVLFVGAVLGALIVGLAATYALGDLSRTHFIHEGLDPRVVATIVDTMHSSLLGAILFTAAFLAVPFALWHADWLRCGRVPNPWLQMLWESMLRAGNLTLTLALALAVLGVAQLKWVANQFIQPWPIKVLTASNPVLDILRHEGDRVRCSVAVDDPTLNFMLQNQFAGMGISCLDISAASRFPRDLSAFFHAYDNNHAALWLLAGVKTVVEPEAGLAELRQHPEVMNNVEHVDGYTLTQTPTPDTPSHAYIVLRDYLTKATLVPGSEVLARDAVLKRMTDGNWNPRESVVLTLADADEKKSAARGAIVTANGDVLSPSDLPQLNGSSSHSDEDHVEIRKYTPTEIELVVESTRNAFVLINDYYDHDWQVQVDDRDRPLLRADSVMRAIAVPAGRSTIEMHYVAHYGPAPVAAVSLLSDGAMLAAWIVSLFALRRDQPAKP
jgi:hypothetical protein